MTGAAGAGGTASAAGRAKVADGRAAWLGSKRLAGRQYRRRRISAIVEEELRHLDLEDPYSLLRRWTETRNSSGMEPGGLGQKGLSWTSRAGR